MSANSVLCTIEKELRRKGEGYDWQNFEGVLENASVIVIHLDILPLLELWDSSHCTPFRRKGLVISELIAPKFQAGSKMLKKKKQTKNAISKWRLIRGIVL
ncbi:hypothetical protein PoB_004478900 [Plakobranchus ocellatus]|uniref:Uncharacterized protein n=1 Tax=Plakobranchus ocellatus TaxID=259542 RepID=A0AAV4BJ05_9GAST|nr:hypothetical protein PoB_004478900 [Plakobranchus ocellatus]